MGEAAEELDDNTPEWAFEHTVVEGYRRLHRSPVALIATGLVGGIDIGIGVLALLIVREATGSSLLAGLAFSIGFVILTLARSELFTENFLVPVSAVIARQATLRRLVRLWVAAFVFNLVGGWVLMWIVTSGFPGLHATAIATGEKYVALGLGWRAFALAMLGGLVITLMTWMQHATTSMGGRLVAAVLAAFLLGAGTLNHTIVASVAMFGALHAGRAPFGYLTWLERALWAALGNVVGGVGLVTILRLLQVPDRVVERRSRPDPEVGETDPEVFERDREAGEADKEGVD